MDRNFDRPTDRLTEYTTCHAGLGSGGQRFERLSKGFLQAKEVLKAFFSKGFKAFFLKAV